MKAEKEKKNEKMEKKKKEFILLNSLITSEAKSLLLGLLVMCFFCEVFIHILG